MPASPDRSRFHFALVAVGLAAATALAAPTDGSRLTLAGAVARALETVPAIESESLRLDAARTTVRETRAALRPRVWVSASGVENDKPSIASPFHGFAPGVIPQFERTLVQTGLSIESTIYDGGATPSRLDQVRHDIAAAGHGLDATRDEIAARTAAAYLTILARSRMLAAHDNRLAALEAELDRVRRLSDVGRAAGVEVLRVDAAMAAADAERVALASDLDTAERSLARLLGADPAETRAGQLADVELIEPAAPNRDEQITRAESASPRIAEAEERAGALRASIRLARSAYYPKLNLFGAVTDYRTIDRGFETDWQAGLQLRVPLWDSGATASRVARAHASASSAAEALRQARLEIAEDVDERLGAIDRALASITSLDRAVKRFEEVARIEKLRVENGAGTQSDYLRAEADLMQARASLAATRYQQIIARIDLARLTGELDGAWIDQQVRNAP